MYSVQYLFIKYKEITLLNISGIHGFLFFSNIIIIEINLINIIL